jgi:putative two-component system response regulator
MTSSSLTAQPTTEVGSATERFDALASPPQSEPVRLRTDHGKSDLSSVNVLIVDDEPLIIKLVRKYLARAGYENFVTTTEPLDAINIIHQAKPDLILLDVMMPDISGLEILERVRSDATTAHIPVIILTASTDEEAKQRALHLGATDFLTKPVAPSDLVPRVRNALCVKLHQDQLEHYAQILEQKVRERTQQLACSHLDLIHCLGRAAEYRDNETGRHVIRVGRYAGVIARQLRLDPTTVELIEQAAPLHDLGKIGVPDSILLKPGKLEPEEFEVMQAHCGMGRRIFERMPDQEWDLAKTHTEIGLKILAGGRSALFTMAATIALTHHERYDGSGYPLGLAGDNIPLPGRITAVADVFDALSSKRPYKPAFPLSKCFGIMREEKGRHFDPRVLDAFLARSEEIVQIQIEHADLD